MWLLSAGLPPADSHVEASARDAGSVEQAALCKADKYSALGGGSSSSSSRIFIWRNENKSQ